MELMELLALLGGTVLAAVILTVTCALFIAPPLDERPLLLGEMAARQHGTPGLRALALAADRPPFAAAVQACVNCASQSYCRAWLNSGGRDGYEAFCPNHGFVARLKPLGS